MMIKAVMLALLAGAYSFQAQLPRGESVRADVQMNGNVAMISVDGKPPVRVDLARTGPPPQRPPRGVPPVVDFLNASTAVAQAGLSGTSSAQMQFGPQRTCVDMHVRVSGGTVTASGSADGPHPLDVYIVETIDHQQLRRAHGEIRPPDGARGPVVTWTLTQNGAQ